MKRVLLITVFTILVTAFSAAAYAADGAPPGDDGAFITVVIPDSKKAPPEPEPDPVPAPAPERCLYPVSVRESLENGRREIIRTYELGAGEKPEDISRESFTRDGWLYELADITRQETASADAKEHKETVSIDTSTNETAAVLKLLAPTMEYQSEDGYTGVLELDISSIKVETAGTKSSSYTVKATREYPGLSSNDTSQIPKTIKDNGRTLTLLGIDWKTQNSAAVDYSRIAESYTGYATYTAAASKTTVTGYITTAEYNGTVSKILTGKPVYTAYFIGVPIVTAAVNDLTGGAGARVKPPEAEPTAELTATGTKAPAAKPKTGGFSVLPLMIAIIFGAGIGGGLMFYYLQKIKKPKEDTAYETKDKAHADEEDSD